MHTRISFTVLLLILTASFASADVYTWRDRDGVVHYGDKPNSDEAQRIAIESRPTDPAEVQARYAARQEQLTQSSEEYESAKAAEEAEAAAQKLSAETQAAACEKAREKLRSYINARRLFRSDADGNPVYLDSDEIDAARASAEQNVAEKCR